MHFSVFVGATLAYLGTIAHASHHKGLHHMLTRGECQAPTITLPPLPYDYAALEPAIKGEIMHLHHDKHHATFVTNYNQAVADLAKAIASGDLTAQLKLTKTINFNAGGHTNHAQFWKILAPPKSNDVKQDPSSPLGKQIVKDFESIPKMIEKMNNVSATMQGSGWAWLGYNVEMGRLETTTTANQDPLLTMVPIIGIDLWEHAYYLQYYNVRADYVKAIWSVINFAEANRRFVAVEKK